MTTVLVIQVALATGIIFSLLIYERFYKLIPAGVIVPGYLALSLSEPGILVFTFLIALVTYSIISLLSNYVILFGRRKFLLSILCSFVVGWSLNLSTERMLSVWLTGTSAIPSSIRIVGYLIPGLIANGFERQGIAKTSFAILFVTMLTYVVLYILFGRL